MLKNAFKKHPLQNRTNVQIKGGGVKGLLNNVQKNCTFLKARHPLGPGLKNQGYLIQQRYNLDPSVYSPGLFFEHTVCCVAGGVVEVNINRAVPGKSPVPWSNLDPGQPPCVVAPVAEGQTQCVLDLEAKAGSKLPPPYEGVHLAKLPVVVVVVEHLRPTAERLPVCPRAKLD